MNKADLISIISIPPMPPKTEGYDEAETLHITHKIIIGGTDSVLGVRATYLSGQAFGKRQFEAYWALDESDVNGLDDDAEIFMEEYTGASMSGATLVARKVSFAGVVDQFKEDYPDVALDGKAGIRGECEENNVVATLASGTTLVEALVHSVIIGGTDTVCGITCVCDSGTLGRTAFSFSNPIFAPGGWGITSKLTKQNVIIGGTDTLLDRAKSARDLYNDWKPSGYSEDTDFLAMWYKGITAITF